MISYKLNEGIRRYNSFDICRYRSDKGNSSACIMRYDDTQILTQKYEILT